MAPKLDSSLLSKALMEDGWGPPQPQPAAGAGVSYKTVDDQKSAEQLLKQLQDEGHLGFVQPVGPNGVYGWEVRHWKK